jgi:hypothetical protein
LPQREEVKKLVWRLRKERGFNEPIDDRDEWTAEDKRDLTAASLRRWDEEEAGKSSDLEIG